MISAVAFRPAVYPTVVSGRTPAAVARGETGGSFTVAAAQAESARAEQSKLAIEATNAAGIKSLAQHGMTLSYRSYAGDYKDNLAKAVDTNGDQAISQAELASQVLRGGGSASAAEGLYAAMDMDGDGEVSAAEFKNAVPDPFGLPGFKDQLQQLMAHGSADPRLVLALYARQAESMDAATVLGGLAGHVPTGT